MAVRSLAYIRVQSRDLSAWSRFAETVVGAAATMDDDGKRLLLRIDARPWRFRIELADTDRYLCAGLECAGEADYLAVLDRVRNAGVTITDGDPVGTRERHVQAFASFNDPAGNAIELCWGNTIAGTPFVSPIGVPSFVTGEMGFGHVVLPTDKYIETRAFYKDLLGFGDSDEMRVYFPGGPEKGLGMSFMHAAGPRHHAVAVGEFPAPSGLIHTMVEVPSVDDVGLAYDRALAAGVHISSTIGRHTNDKMLSFYMRTPSGFDIEYGCDGQQFPDWSVVTPTFTIKEDLWGHKWDFSQ
ncbi:glyoxalase [Sphingomonas paeninsulae]|uniref:Glyoxalase n=1 Tax=Sphingomonas paeninsulae TaxID=2319844 RepID=A0A494THY3_SPHPE|nr:VOC family protein [Sphingomonas paeninsulae]AYJ87084.1 glyoxalase [Sphingomonas paeninsulae]